MSLGCDDDISRDHLEDIQPNNSKIKKSMRHIYVEYIFFLLFWSRVIPIHIFMLFHFRLWIPKHIILSTVNHMMLPILHSP